MTDFDHRSDTRIGEQPALRTSTGRSWLIMGALMMVATGGLLLALSTRQPSIGFVGAGLVVVLYVFMIAATAFIRATRARLVTLAVLLGLMAATALGFVLAITTAEWSLVL